MFQLTSYELDSVVQRTGFFKNPIEKALRILDILSVLKSNPVMKDAFVLKGGTALNFFILEWPRLSVDIDLNYIRSIPRSEMFEDRSQLTSEVEKLFRPEYQIEITKEVHALTQFSFHYETLSGSIDALRIDINYLLRMPILSPKIKIFKHLDLNVDFLCLDPHELMAGKIVTLLSRYMPRDLFDVHHALRSSLEWDNTLLRSLILYFGLLTRENLWDLFKLKFGLIKNYDLRNDLSSLLRRKTDLDRDVMVESVEKFLSQFLELKEEETEAAKVFYETGQLNCDLFFPQEGLHEKILASPALQWKVQNIKKKIN